MKAILRFSLWLLVIGFFACKTDAGQSLSSNTIVIRTSTDFTGLNPVNQSGGTAIRIMKHILPSLVDFDPISMTYTPVLLDTLPEKLNQSEKVAYSFSLRKEAKWPNGQPITINDYIFSLKVAFNRKIRGNAWTRALSIIDDVIVNKEDNRACTVILKKDIADAMGYFAGFELLPEYHYDPKHLLAPFPLKEFLTIESFDKLWTSNPEIVEFANDFSQEKYIRSPEGVVGAGPYRLERWESNTEIVLVKKKNYWADGLENVTLLLAGNPDTITYKIVADEVATSILIKNSELDVVPYLSTSEFIKLRENPSVAANYNFYTPSAQSTFLVLLNTQSPKLDKSVRNALARCIDLNQLIEVATSGLGKKIISPISSSSKYYNKNLKPIEKDVAVAKELLKEGGWVDADNDGILEKEMNGQTTRLEMDIIIGSNPVGKVVGPIFKAAAGKIGIKINIVSVSGKEILGRLRSPKFEMAIVRFVTSPTDYVPYGSWHSDNAGQKGKNFTRFSSAKMDAVIDGLELATSFEQKKKLYDEFQEILYLEQPALFLFSPVKTIVVHNRWEPVISSIRPGYFENAFRLKKE